MGSPPPVSEMRLDVAICISKADPPSATEWRWALSTGVTRGPRHCRNRHRRSGGLRLGATTRVPRLLLINARK